MARLLAIIALLAVALTPIGQANAFISTRPRPYRALTKRLPRTVRMWLVAAVVVGAALAVALLGL
jgi:hypothetical protein